VVAEGVVAEQDLLAGQVAEHGVRPMQHGRFDEDELAFAQAQALAGFHHLEIPVLVVVPFEGFDAIGRAVHGHAGDEPHEFRQAAAMVAFGVVGNDVVDGREVHLGLELLDELAREGGPDRFDERGLLVAHQIGVVGAALVRGILLAMETLEFPVALAHPGHGVGDFEGHMAAPLF